ncbi:ROK family protein [Rubrivivax rivuli]|nr:ROK family protein [Rubrivivax rivuli]
MNAPADGACLALDIGGTKLRAGLVAADGRVLVAQTHASHATAGAARVMAAVQACCDELRAAASAQGCRLLGIGVSAAGVIDTETGCVLRAGDTMPGWAGTALATELQARHGLPVRADNDVNCALRGELWLGGHGPRPGLTLMLALGTGLGAALAHDGRIVTGAHQHTGHWGWRLVWHPVQGRLVPLESLVSGTGLRNLYRHHGGTQPGALAAGTAVVELAQRGDGAAGAALAEWVDLLAVQLHNDHWSLDPALVLLGGGVIGSQAAWWPALQQRLQALGAPLPLRAATLGNDAGMLGAAALAWQAFGGGASEGAAA